MELRAQKRQRKEYSEALSQSCLKQESCARVWIFGSLRSDSFYLNTVALWVLASFFSWELCISPHSHRFRFSHLRQRQRTGSQRNGRTLTQSLQVQTGEQRGPAQRVLQTGIVSQAFWSSWEPETCSQAFVCMGLKLRFPKTIVNCTTMYRKPNIRTPPFAPIFIFFTI